MCEQCSRARALLSFTPTNDLFKPGLYVEEPTVANYVYTMAQDNPFVRYFWQQIGSSLVVALWAMVVVAWHLEGRGRPFHDPSMYGGAAAPA